MSELRRYDFQGSPPFMDRLCIKKDGEWVDADEADKALSEQTRLRVEAEGKLKDAFWECEDCGYKIAKEHENADGSGYTCLCCQESETEKERTNAEDALTKIIQDLRGALTEAEGDAERLATVLGECLTDFGCYGGVSQHREEEIRKALKKHKAAHRKDKT